MLYVLPANPASSKSSLKTLRQTARRAGYLIAADYTTDTFTLVDARLRDWGMRQAPQHGVLERAQAMPKQGASSGFKYGRAVGAIEAAITCCAVPLTIIEPTGWKKFHGLRGGDKETSRQRALQLFPTAHVAPLRASSMPSIFPLLARKKDHGRAEAALIAMAPVHGAPSNAITTPEISAAIVRGEIAPA